MKQIVIQIHINIKLHTFIINSSIYQTINYHEMKWAKKSQRNLIFVKIDRNVRDGKSVDYDKLKSYSALRC